jgi:DNA-binding transcriptional regulator YdaS (Cro superfamily)
MKMHEFLATPKGRPYSQAEWARRIGITRGYLHQLVNGGKVPSLQMALIVHRVTEGQVTPFDWLDEEATRAGSHSD